MSSTSLSRRNFLRTTGLSGSALFLGLYFPSNAKGGKFISIQREVVEDIEMNAWIHIDTGGKVTLFTHRAEMGQGAYQSVPQIIAEELEVDMNDISIRFAPGNRKKYGNQVTGGSSTISGSYLNLLKLGASAREMLISAAAIKWNVPLSDCYAQSGHVVHRSTDKKLNFGELVIEASRLELPDVPLKKRADYKLIGKPLPRKDTPLKTNGEAVFGLDFKLPGMLYAVVERNPRLRGKLVSFDASEALKVPGVKKVFKIQTGVYQTFRDGVAVVAENTWSAIQGRKALKIEWDDTGFEHVNTADIYTQQKELLANSEGLIAIKQGEPDTILSTSSGKLDVVYETPYQSHSAMEPLNCVAYYQPDKLEIWGPLQAPEWIQDYMMAQFNLPQEKVIVNLTFLGGGFGRKALMDYPHEASLISKETGTPVQIVWTREDDMTQGPYRAGVSYRCEGAIAEGQLSALKFRMAGQNVAHWQGGAKTEANGNTTEGFLAKYFKGITHVSFSDIPFETPIPITWWRSVYASTNGFAYESFMNEMAHAAKIDPLDFRRGLLKDEREQRLLDKMVVVSDWKNRKKGSGFGLAITECFSTTVGQIVKVSKAEEGKIKIDQVWAVVDCGWYVNPDIIRAQVEGSILMAFGAAISHEITFKNGLVEQRNFYDYVIPRINDMPPIEVHIMENEEKACGIGEAALPPFAPALTEAIYDLTGKRIRKLPFDLNSL
ncbi:molybdopterin-dependent oxidoreductase [Algoriphagus sp. AGSA1]|uniref:molybdopterin cofactor-binding domain-containing protein n=1 Tax=Algoriphagus sp. AGSA1 TaxID=2907213 RepID=UPI001F1BB791|nr:molybdopterin cofactor-binding domain-containing protein [Algoriphagus sp. AGSA1]MCE7054276.1 molybdopterin-dependent oxidoreductase [Algoriphagus sp. AGSA1]